MLPVGLYHPKADVATQDDNAATITLRDPSDSTRVGGDGWGSGGGTVSTWFWPD